MSSFKNTPNVGGPLLDTIIEDHKGIWSYYDEYANSAGDVDAQTRWANQFKWHVARHAIAEELVLYPLMEQHMGEEGKQIAEEDRGIHQRVKEILYELESHAPDSKEHATLLKEAVDILKQHGNHEEQVEFLKLQNALGDEGAAKAAASFERTKLLAPTRSHPSAPARPPFETLAGLLAAPMDKIRDLLSQFPTKEETDSVRRERKL
ncbi:hypothetical protein CPC08DRAFT_737814 [Agrocybe pediades]|nr:hypothetical protein CPC08DRAFT_737814 [Agrocybe pediades]